jgi:hypothetical protein
MAIGAIGNTIFVNQQTASVTSIASSHNNRVEFQNMLAQERIKDREEKVLEIRPSEQNHDIDPDREHEKNEADQETDRSEQHKHEHEEEETTLELNKVDLNIHQLDIKV